MKSNLMIFDFDCPHDYLNEVWKVKSARNPSYSIRAWSKSMGFNNNFLSFLLKKERKFSKKNVHVFVVNLKLNPSQAEFFEALIDHSIQTTKGGRDYYRNKIATLRKISSLTGKTLESFKFLEDPLHLLISELIKLNNFKSDPAFIRRILKNEATTSEISEAIQRLISLGIVGEKDNKLIPLKTHSVYIHGDEKGMMDKASENYHKRILEFTMSQLKDYNTKTAKFANYIFNIKEGDFKRIEHEYNRFIHRLIHSYESEVGKGDRTYIFNHQIFPATE